jgi:hypothetical protein
MNDKTIDQIEEEVLSYEVSDEAVEVGRDEETPKPIPICRSGRL